MQTPTNIDITSGIHCEKIMYFKNLFLH